MPTPKVAAFEGLLHEIITAARGFDGHLGVDVLRPEAGGVYRIIFRYRGAAEHQMWMASDERKRLVSRIDELLGAEHPETVRAVNGWEGWFVNPGYAPPVPPKRWKMAALTLTVLYPVVLGLGMALKPLTHGWPLPLGMLLTMGLTIPFMTWVLMPALTTRLGPWLRR
ncbi:antibiotic biosynthesis monooxygenase [Nocardia sp. SYP-A9097]|uniref:antibiotic biosynthesis monooxygenase n=1 Tax=Nocardia sp. SYP-A9097 TaxID=2663237 RepID=UPI00129BA164|nr:antibiotic biosynthesis monooxygenase [Nocardia sp. SYP-A9097]